MTEKMTTKQVTTTDALSRDLPAATRPLAIHTPATTTDARTRRYPEAPELEDQLRAAYSRNHPTSSVALVDPLDDELIDPATPAPTSGSGVECSERFCARPATRQAYSPTALDHAQPWADSNYETFCDRHAPRDSWPLVESEK